MWQSQKKEFRIYAKWNLLVYCYSSERIRRLTKRNDICKCVMKKIHLVIPQHLTLGQKTPAFSEDERATCDWLSVLRGSSFPFPSMKVLWPSTGASHDWNGAPLQNPKTAPLTLQTSYKGDEQRWNKCRFDFFQCRWWKCYKLIQVWDL